MSMTLEEAIIHAEEAANTYEDMMDDYALDSKKLHKCANEHRQLAEWLRELQERRKQSEIIHCKDCRWNDGVCYCEFHYRDVKPTGYCSWSERRINDSV